MSGGASGRSAVWAQVGRHRDIVTDTVDAVDEILGLNQLRLVVERVPRSLKTTIADLGKANTAGHRQPAAPEYQP
jgi:hypothetical protein